MINTLLFIRHGATPLNPQKVHKGWLDVPLSEEGIKEVEKTANELKGQDIRGIITGDLIRTKQTAEIISRITGFPIIKTSKDFRPLDVGELEGQKIDETKNELRYYVENPDIKIPKGESFNTFKNRFLDGLNEVIKKYEGIVILVSHSKNEVLIDAWLKAGIDNDDVDTEYMMDDSVRPGGIVRYEIANNNGSSNLLKEINNLSELLDLKRKSYSLKK